MTWPEVVRWLVLFMGAAAPLMAVIWTVGRIFRPWMRSEAQEAANQVRAEVRALADKLATNDLPHMENRIVKQMDEMGKRMDRMSARMDGMDTKMGKRMDRIEARMDGMESKMDKRMDGMESKMDKRMDRMESLLLAALPHAATPAPEALGGP